MQCNGEVSYDEIKLQCSLVFKYMVFIFLFMRYSRRKLNYLEKIRVSDVALMMSVADHVAMNVETLKINSGCSLEKEFTKLARMNS